jgi:hypothetical protein
MVKTAALVHAQPRFQVVGKLPIRKCDLFQDDAMLTVSRSTLTWQVLQSDIRTLVSALEGASVRITKDSMGGQSRQCEELQLGELAERLSQFGECEDLKEEVTQKDFEVRKCLSALEEGMQQHDCEIAALWTEQSRHLLMQESSSEARLGRVTRFEADVRLCEQQKQGGGRC